MNDLDSNKTGDIEQTIHLALDASAKIAMTHFRNKVEFDIKQDDSPVTIADREAEAAVRKILAERFPQHAIVGEEQGHTSGDGGTWVIDPIDGTKSFLLGNPLFGSLLAYVENNVVLAGGMAMPALGEVWYADRNHATTMNGERCETSACNLLANASLLTSSPEFFNPSELAQFKSLSKQVRYLRYGGDCYTYAMLAGGWVDLVVESSLYPFDYLALVPIVEQAGGVISDWEGQPLGLNSGPQVIAAATEELHQAALTVLNTAKTT